MAATRPPSPPDKDGIRVTLVIKTNEGGTWVLPQLQELRRRGADVTVILPAGDGKLRRSLDLAGFDVRESPFDFDFSLRMRLVTQLRHLRRTLRESAPDIIFYHLYASALASRLSSLGMRVRRVHMVAGPLYLENPWIRFAERFLSRLDTNIIAGSDYTAKAYHRIGYPKGRIVSVPYGVDLTHFAPATDERENLLGVGANTFVVIMVAYVYAPKNAVFPGVGVKGHEIILDVWKHFTRDHPDSMLLLVGGGFDESGEEHRQLLMSAHEIRTSASVRWIDSVDDVRPYYSSADLSVSPSLSENHGAALEASAMGVPSIVSDAGGLPETVVPGSGWVVPAGDRDSLLLALQDARHLFDQRALDRMGRTERQHMSRQFSLHKCVRRVADVVLGASS